MTAGPDAGRWMELHPGRHLLGRDRRCAVVVDDPAVEAHHVLLDIDDDDRLDVIQLAGRIPVVHATTHLEIGDSRIDLTPNRVSDGGRELLLGITVETPLGQGSGMPVLLDSDSLAIVDDHPDFTRARAILRSLSAQAAALGRAMPAHQLALSGDSLLDDHPAVLELGARWRARWTCRGQSVRLHAAGMSQVFMNNDARRSAIRQPSSVR